MTTRRFDYSASIAVQRPVDAVAAFLTEPSNAQQWAPPSTHLDWRAPGPLTLGSVLEHTLHVKDSGTHHRSWVVVKFVPTEGFMLRSRFESDKMPEWFPVHEEFEYQWASLSRAETGLSLRWRTRVNSWGGVIAEYTLGQPNRFAVPRQLRRLKKILEATITPT